MSDKVLIIRAKKKVKAQELQRFRDLWCSQIGQGLIVMPNNDFEFAYMDKSDGRVTEIKWIQQIEEPTLLERIKRIFKR